MNIYAASQYLQAWGVIKGTTGLLGSLQHYFQSIGGIPAATIIIHGIFPVGILGLFLKKKEEKPKENMKITESGTVNVLIQDKGLITNQITTILYSETNTTNPESPIQRYFIILNDQKRYKLIVNLSDEYILKGMSNSTIYVQLQRNNPMRFRQLSLSEMGMDPNKAKPINEDMGKVLAKIYQDNINMKKKSSSIIAGLTKALFYTFMLSIVVYAIMYGVNMYFESLSINALHAATSAWALTAARIGGYHLVPVVNSTNTTIASNIITHVSR